MSHQEHALYFAIGLPVGIVSGIITVFIAKRDGATDSDALLSGGAFGGLFGVFWPFTLFGTLIGLIGLGTWYGWKSMRSIFDESKGAS